VTRIPLLLGLLALPQDGRDRGRRGVLGELAGSEVVAQIARRDLDDASRLAETVDVLQQDCLGH